MSLRSLTRCTALSSRCFLLAGVAVTHTWGGPLGVPRDWFASVGLDRATGLAWAGGYVGDGVATSNLAGRTLADLILDATPTSRLCPWVNHQLARVGARAVAMARRQRRAPRDDQCRRC